MEKEKKLYAIYHEYDSPDVEGCYHWCESELKGIVLATEQEIKDYISKWDKPQVWGHSTFGGDMCRQMVRAEEVIIQDLETLIPYEDYTWFGS